MGRRVSESGKALDFWFFSWLFMVVQCFLGSFYSIRNSMLDFYQEEQLSNLVPFFSVARALRSFRQLDAVVRSRNSKNRALPGNVLLIDTLFFHTFLSLHIIHIHIVEISPFKLRHRIFARQPRNGGGSRQQLTKCACVSRDYIVSRIWIQLLG